MDPRNSRITVQPGTHIGSNEGKEFRYYVASYFDPNNHFNNTHEQAGNPRAALENLYVTLESKGFSRDALPKPQFLR